MPRVPRFPSCSRPEARDDELIADGTDRDDFSVGLESERTERIGAGPRDAVRSECDVELSVGQKASEIGPTDGGTALSY